MDDEPYMLLERTGIIYSLEALYDVQWTGAPTAAVPPPTPVPTIGSCIGKPILEACNATCGNDEETFAELDGRPG